MSLGVAGGSDLLPFFLACLLLSLLRDACHQKTGIHLYSGVPGSSAGRPPTPEPVAASLCRIPSERAAFPGKWFAGAEPPSSIGPLAEVV